MKINYFDHNQSFFDTLDLLNVTLKEDYSLEFFEKFLGAVASFADCKEKPLWGRPIERSDMIPYFLETISTLENKDISDYYRNRIQTLDIEYRKWIKRGAAQLKLDKVGSSLYVSGVLLPYAKSTELDMVSFAHEMGHIPTYENKLKSIEESAEYLEVLPIFMEYIASTTLRKGNSGRAFFTRNRLCCEQSAVKCMINDYPLYLERTDEIGEKTYRQISLMESCKYLISSDIAFQLTDLYREDRKTLINEIEPVVIGDQSVKGMVEHLGIESQDCKRLAKEFKRANFNHQARR